MRQRFGGTSYHLHQNQTGEYIAHHFRVIRGLTDSGRESVTAGIVDSLNLETQAPTIKFRHASRNACPESVSSSLKGSPPNATNFTTLKVSTGRGAVNDDLGEGSRVLSRTGQDGLFDQLRLQADAE